MMAITLSLGLSALGVSAGNAAPPHPPQDGRIIYWGVDASGTYFETIPLDASNPANVGVKDPQHSLTQNPAAKPTYIRDADSKVLTGDDARAAMKMEAAAAPPGGFVCSRLVSGMTIISRTMTGSTMQQCTGQFINHWIDYQVQREVAWYQVEYLPWTTTISSAATQATWTFNRSCKSGQTSYGKYRWNTRGWARAINGVVAGGNEVWGTPQAGTCGV